MSVSRKAVILLAIVFVLALVVPLPGGGPRWEGPLGDMVHGPVFALFAVLLCRGLRAWRGWSVAASAVAVWAALVLFGAATEVFQHFVQRNMSLHDFLADATGATAGVFWTIGRSRTQRIARRGWTLSAALALLLTAVWPVLILVDCRRQYVEFPMLASFENALEMTRWAPWECRFQRSPRHATNGAWSLRADLSTGTTYPGVGMTATPWDWTGHDALIFDLHLNDGPPLELVVKIEDIESRTIPGNRFEKVIRLSPGPNRVRIALADVAAAPVGRTLDLRRITFFQLFAVNPTQTRAIHLDNVHLE